MSTEEYIEAMDEAIAAYKQEQREDAEKMLIKMAAKLYEAYKEYNPNGDYLHIGIRDNVISINNAYYDEDSQKPINAYDDGEFNSNICHTIEEEQDDVND